MNEQVQEKLKAVWKQGGWQKALVTVGLLGMALILVSQLLPKKQPAQTPETPAATATVSLVTAAEYAHALEERLVEAVRRIEGVGSCSAMVTLENGVEYVYANQQKNSSDQVEDSGGDSSRISQKDNSERSVIVVDTGSGKQGLVVTEIQPTVKGVLLVCEGGGDAAVQARVTQAVTTVLGITSKRVCVSPMQ